MTNKEQTISNLKKLKAFHNGSYGADIDKAIKALEQEPKTGHWKTLGIQGEVDGQIVQVFTCSECGAISIFRMASGNIVNGDICPNCGARMTESEDKA